MKNNIDLHIHSSYSDGKLTPKQIIDTAYKNMITTIAIADHDTIDAYNDELFKYAKEKNINLITSVEISTKLNNLGVHILGYNFDLNNPLLITTLKSLKNARLDYLNNVSISLKKIGYTLNTNKLKELPTVTKTHISQDIIDNPQNKELLLKHFNHIPNKGEFIETIMNENCPAYVKKFSISPLEAASIIKQAGGTVILAHPIAYIYEDNLSFNDIDNLIKMINPDGIEANYIYIDKNNNIHDESSYWNIYAEENNLISTIGSDFHDSDNLHPEIGFTNFSINIIDEEKIIQSITKKTINLI